MTNARMASQGRSIFEDAFVHQAGFDVRVSAVPVLQSSSDLPTNLPSAFGLQSTEAHHFSETD
jgi:hypothetical protein